MSSQGDVHWNKSQRCEQMPQQREIEIERERDRGHKKMAHAKDDFCRRTGVLATFYTQAKSCPNVKVFLPIALN